MKVIKFFIAENINVWEQCRIVQGMSEVKGVCQWEIETTKRERQFKELFVCEPNSLREQSWAKAIRNEREV